MQIRVTFASDSPIPDDLVARCAPTRIVAAEAAFGHVVHAFADSDDPEALRAELRATADGVAVGVIDGALVACDAGIVMCDVDSTFTTTEAVDLLAEHAGRGDEVGAITEQAMRGELDFEQSLRQRVATLKGLPTTVFDEVYPLMRPTPGARELVDIAHARGARVGVTSGGFTQLVSRLADDFGLDFFAANQLQTTRRDGVEYLTGEVEGRIVDRLHKSLDLRELAAAHDVPLERTVAAGDGANDLTMLATAGLGVAFCAKPVTAAQADVAVDFPRLDAVAAFAFPE